MNKTKIDWADYTWNPVVGCKRGCEYCYARKIHERFSKIPFSELAYYDERLNDPIKIKKPSRIFVGSMSDICYWGKAYVGYVIDTVKMCPQHTFYFLTKDPAVYSENDYPDNCWLGVTVTGDSDIWEKLDEISKYKNNFVSYEPLLSLCEIDEYMKKIKWLIVGGLSPKPIHNGQWVKTIIDYARKSKVPIFLKNNLHYPDKIQEYPK